ncbi:MAG: division/cell wall cluster transcriptional repressor MraZ [Alphaproteobacteria bacterium]|jgi:MraZ protein|nr:division/cell wall cluster transcriptional repressor MraZ [Alphaproteobacteria bacterium]MBP9867800.1 division/cell wall cluster transcriptional repressor MraZ [Alphaproteobacteria bacterium]
MPIFLSQFLSKLDRKGRVTVPAPFRAALLGQPYQGVVLFKATNHPCLEGFDFSTMEELSLRLDQFDLFSSEQDDLATTIFGEAVPCPFDSEGRIGIPDGLLEFAGIHENATFVGLGRKFQVWDAERFETRRLAARAHVIDKGMTLPKIKAGGAEGA